MSLFSQNAGKSRPEKTQNSGTFHAMKANWIHNFMCDFLDNLGATFRRVITCIEN